MYNVNSFILYRDKLVKAGLIEFKKGHKGQPNKYKLIPITDLWLRRDSINESINGTINESINDTTNVQLKEKEKQNKTKQKQLCLRRFYKIKMQILRF